MNNELIGNEENLLIYKNEEENIIVDAIFKNETLQLTQKEMSKVFGCSVDNISLHLKIFLKIMSQMKMQLPRKPR